VRCSGRFDTSACTCIHSSLLVAPPAMVRLVGLRRARGQGQSAKIGLAESRIINGKTIQHERQQSRDRSHGTGLMQGTSRSRAAAEHAIWRGRRRRPCMSQLPSQLIPPCSLIRVTPANPPSPWPPPVPRAPHGLQHGLSPKGHRLHQAPEHVAARVLQRQAHQRAARQWVGVGRAVALRARGGRKAGSRGR
jgi:hypothetical protein